MRLRKKQSLRIVSGFLAASMALSAFPATAVAAGANSVPTAENSVVETQASCQQALTFDDKGIPTSHGNAESGWMYDSNIDVLWLLPGYEFGGGEQTVGCMVMNAGTITGGTFAKRVSNVGHDADQKPAEGTITGGTFIRGIMNSVSNDGTVYEGTITGGTFGEIYTVDGKLPDNTYVLGALGCTINDVFENQVVVAGKGNQVKVTLPDDNDDFESWKTIDGITFSDPTSRTIEFEMPEKNVMLSINYKDNALEFDADGIPTHAGGKNWERIYGGKEDGKPVYVLALYDGAVLDTTSTVKGRAVLAYPGSIIRNGTFETEGVVVNFGTIENGTFDSTNSSMCLINGGSIQDGTFKKTVDNFNVKMSSAMDTSQYLSGINMAITECPGLINGGTFEGTVMNFGVIKDGTFSGTVTSAPVELMDGGQLEQQGITYTSTTEISNGEFNGQVLNGADITGGRFREQVYNAGTITNGVFYKNVKNTTSNDSEIGGSGMSLSDTGVATMSLLGTDADFAVEMQNAAGSTEKVYVGSITDGFFVGTVTNNGGTITGGVFIKEPVGDGIENVHKLTAEGSSIGTAQHNYYNESGQASSLSVKNSAYVVGKQKVRVIGAEGTHSWKSDDVDLSNATLAMDGKVISFTMPGDRDVTLTASTEKPNQIVVDKDTKLEESTNKNIENEGTISKGEYTGEIKNNNTIEGGSFSGAVTNDEAGKITDGEFTGEVKNNGTIEQGTFNGSVTNDSKGVIADGSFTGEVKNSGTIQNGTFAETVTNDGTIQDGKFAGEVKGSGKIEGGTFQKVTEASEITGGVFGAQSKLDNAKITPSSLKIESSIADGSLVNDIIGNSNAVAALALFAENDIATQAAETETVAYVVGEQTLTVKYAGTDKHFDKWDTTGLTDAKLSEDGKTVTFTVKSNAGDVTLNAVQKKSDTKPTEPAKPQQPAQQGDDGTGALIAGGVLLAGGVATGVIAYTAAMDYIKSVLPEGAAIPETREQLAVALWENAGKPEVAVEEGVVLTDTEKAMRWAVEKQILSAEGEDSVSKIDVLVAVYKAKNL